MDNQDDLQYIDRIISGDTSCFAFLVNKYKQQAYTLALRIVKNEEDAGEVSQDSFLKAYRSLGKFKREASFSSWLYRIVYNTALSRIRKKNLNTTQIDVDGHQVSVDETDTAFGQLVAKDRKKFLVQALNQLPEDEATMISLFYSHEKTTEEIGGIMGLSHSNVRVKLLRSRKKLLVFLNKELKQEINEML